MDRRQQNERLREVAGIFLRLGATAFGGPAAHVALMEEEFVRRRAWVSHAEFIDLLGATQLIPGPNSTEMALHLGHRRAGLPGLVVAGLGFILPAVVLVMGAAWAYVRFGTLPAFHGLMAGAKPVLIVVVGQALWHLRKAALRTPWTAALGLAAFVASAAGIGELPVLLGAGALAVARNGVVGSRATKRPGSLPAWIWLPGAAGSLAPAVVPFTNAGLFGVFLKIGSVLYGSGYVLLAFLRTDLVERRHWLTEGQLLDAVAVGQFTPGPVFASATFVGYLLGGATSALLATAGIFLPAFVLVAASGALVPRLRAWPPTAALMDGVNAASFALMAMVSARLALSAVTEPSMAAIGIVAAAVLFRWRVNSAWLVAAGGIAGLLIQWARQF